MGRSRKKKCTFKNCSTDDSNQPTMNAVSTFVVISAVMVFVSSRAVPNDISSEIYALKSRMAELEKKIGHGAYGKFTAQDLQWQSLHMAAAAACRGATLGGGSEHDPNRVFARSAGHSCTAICKASPYKNCDATLSIMGYMGKAKDSTHEVGWFYNYGCGNVGAWPEPQMSWDITTVKTGYAGYCCCRA